MNAMKATSTNASRSATISADDRTVDARRGLLRHWTVVKTIVSLRLSRFFRYYPILSANVNAGAIPRRRRASLKQSQPYVSFGGTYAWAYGISGLPPRIHERSIEVVVFNVAEDIRSDADTTIAGVTPDQPFATVTCIMARLSAMS